MKYLIIALLLCTNIASAEVTVKDYREIMDSGSATSRAKLNTYILGVNSGYGWANAELSVSGNPQLYCGRDNVTFSSDVLKVIIDTEISRDTEFSLSLGMDGNIDHKYISSLLLNALMRRYPCKTNP